MRSLEEIRTEMQDAAAYYKLSKDAGLEVPAVRWEATYDTLAWVLEESWKNTGDLD